MKRLKNEESWKYVNEKSSLKQTWVSQRLRYATNLEEVKSKSIPPTISKPFQNKPAPIQPLKLRHRFKFSPNPSSKEFCHQRFDPKGEDSPGTDKSSKSESSPKKSTIDNQKTLIKHHKVMSSDKHLNKSMINSGSTYDTDYLEFQGRFSAKSSPKTYLNSSISKATTHLRSKSMNAENINIREYSNMQSPQSFTFTQQCKTSSPTKTTPHLFTIFPGNVATRYQNLFYGTLKNRPNQFLADGNQLKI